MIQWFSDVVVKICASEKLWLSWGPDGPVDYALEYQSRDHESYLGYFQYSQIILIDLIKGSEQ